MAQVRPSAPMASPGSAPVPSSPGVGTPLGRYALLDRIGEGGMAEIFTAVSFGSGGFRRSFVVKRLRPEMATNPVAVAHFIDEANLATTLVHPNIVPVFDFGEVAGSYFLAQEYIVGRDLGRLTRRMVERNIPAISPQAALYIAHEMLRGLHYAHEKRQDDGAVAGSGPSRRHAGERHDLRAGRGEDPGLRHREGGDPRVPDGHRHGEGQRRLHVPRTGARAARWIADRTCSRPGWCCTSPWPGRRCTGARPCSIG